MPAKVRFAAGWHQRPLLGFVRAELSEWAARQGLSFVEDPSNRDTRFDRNFLRHEILPRLKSRWPSIAATVSRSARHLAEADGLLDELADYDLRTAVKHSCLSVTRLRELDAPRRRLLLRRWIRSRGLLLPATRTLAAMEHDLLMAADDRAPCVKWPGAQVHRHRDWLYAEAALLEIIVPELTWCWDGDITLPAELGVLRMQGGDPRESGPRIGTRDLPPALTIRFRQGGERIRLPGEKHRRELKKLLQSSQVLPWWRERLPLIYAGDSLVAVADLWVSNEFAAKQDEPGVKPHWEHHYGIYSV
jgi:tRNA(Ile)-lysidine synthase